MLRWLFRRSVTRDEAVAIASRYVTTLGYRVVPTPEAGGTEGGVTVDRAELGGRRWSVWFKLQTPGRVSVPGAFWVWVHTDTGEPELCPPLA